METTNSAFNMLSAISDIEKRLETHDMASRVETLNSDSEYSMGLLEFFIGKKYPNYETFLRRDLETNQIYLLVRKTTMADVNRIIDNILKGLETHNAYIYARSLDMKSETMIATLLFYLNKHHPGLKTNVSRDFEQDEISLHVSIIPVETIKDLVDITLEGLELHDEVTHVEPFGVETEAKFRTLQFYFAKHHPTFKARVTHDFETKQISLHVQKIPEVTYGDN